MEYGYMAKLREMKKTQRNLLDELHDRGYPRLYQQQLSSYLNGVNRGPQSVAVLKIVDDVLDEWKAEQQLIEERRRRLSEKRAAGKRAAV